MSSPNAERSPRRQHSSNWASGSVEGSVEVIMTPSSVRRGENVTQNFGLVEGWRLCLTDCALTMSFRSTFLPLLISGFAIVLHAGDEPLKFNDPKPQRYTFTARASEIDPRAQPHPEIDFVFE